MICHVCGRVCLNTMFAELVLQYLADIPHLTAARGRSRELEFRLEFLRLVSDYEHWVPLNLPLGPIKVPLVLRDLAPDQRLPEPWELKSVCVHADPAGQGKRVSA